MFMKVKVTQSCLTLCHSMYSLWNSPGQNTAVGSHSLLQGIFPTQGSNPSLPHCGRILYQLSHQGSPRILEWVAYLLQESNPGSPALQADSLPAKPPGNVGVYDRIPCSFVCLKYFKRQMKESCCLHAYVLCSSQNAVSGEQERFIFPS